jgi:hypothetical protein
VAFVIRSVTLIKSKPVKLSSFFDQARPRSRVVIPTTTATPSGTTTTTLEATTTATIATTTTNPGRTTIPFATASNKQFVVNRRGSSQPWTTLFIDDWLKTIRHGFQIPFTSPPPLRVQPQRTIPYNQQDQLLDQEVSLLLNKGAIEEIQPITPLFYSSMFVIPKKNGGSRPVFNLKKLNNYIQASHFKMETLQEVTK